MVLEYCAQHLYTNTTISLFIVVVSLCVIVRYVLSCDRFLPKSRLALQRVSDNYEFSCSLHVCVLLLRIFRAVYRCFSSLFEFQNACSTHTNTEYCVKTSSKQLVYGCGWTHRRIDFPFDASTPHIHIPIIWQRVNERWSQNAQTHIRTHQAESNLSNKYSCTAPTVLYWFSSR